MDNQQPSRVKEKKCRFCGQDKVVSEFRVYRAKGRRDRVTDVCVSCHSERLREWYEKRKANRTADAIKMASKRASAWRKSNPKKRKAIAKRYNDKVRERDRREVYKHYGRKCECCGETNPLFLTIDHINNDGCVQRKKGVYTNGSQFYRWIIEQNFPSDLRLLCYNCNLGRARNGGVCPHAEGSTTIP